MAHPTTEDWNAAAATYDEGPDHGLLDPGVRRAWLALLRSRLPPAPADVVDLGCGTGTLSVLLAQEGHRVRGIDTAGGMVRAARRKARDADVRVAFELGDADHPAYPPGSCDVVLVRHVLWALPDPAEAIGRWVTSCAQAVACCSSRDRGIPAVGYQPVTVSRRCADTAAPW